MRFYIGAASTPYGHRSYTVAATDVDSATLAIQHHAASDARAPLTMIMVSDVRPEFDSAAMARRIADTAAVRHEELRVGNRAPFFDAGAA